MYPEALPAGLMEMNVKKEEARDVLRHFFWEHDPYYTTRDAKSNLCSFKTKP